LEDFLLFDVFDLSRRELRGESSSLKEEQRSDVDASSPMLSSSSFDKLLLKNEQKF